jgi:surface protein
MKKFFTSLFFLTTIVVYSQTPITDSNIHEAVNTCLSTHPVTGLCTDSEYGSITEWDVSNVTNMYDLFVFKTQFNGDISSWDVSNVTNMGSMFRGTPFNQDISSWDVSNVTNMLAMFSNVDGNGSVVVEAKFNQDISSWDVSNVINATGLFHGTDFNQDISSWNVESMTDMSNMFRDTPFNGDISSWDVSNVTNMSGMFFNSSFNQDISGWCVTNISSEPESFSINSPLSESNKPVWGSCPDSPLGTNDQNLINISIYPNPVTDKLFFQGLSNVSKVSVYNVLGKLVLSKMTLSEIDVSNLKNGIYLIKVTDIEGQLVHRFIKK